MALPRDLGAYRFGVGGHNRLGPYRTGGVTYLVALNPTSSFTTVYVLKSSDPATTAFSEVASWLVSITNGDGNFDAVDSYFANGKLYIAVADNASNASIAYRAFDLVSETWDHAQVSIATQGTNVRRVHVVARSNGDAVLFHQGDTQKVAGTNYARIVYSIVDNTGTVTASKVNVGPSGDANHRLINNTALLLGGSDRIHFLWDSSHVAMDSANTFGTIGATGSSGTFGHGGRYDPSAVYFRIPTSSGAVLGFTDALTPASFTFTTGVADNGIATSNGIPRVWVRYDSLGDSHYPYTQSTSPSYSYRDKSAYDATSWGVDIEFLTVSGGLYTVNVYDGVIAAVYQDFDTGTWYYSEFDPDDGSAGNTETADLYPASDVANLNTQQVNAPGSDHAALRWGWSTDDLKIANYPGADGWTVVGMDPVPSFSEILTVYAKVGWESPDALNSDSCAYYAQVFYDFNGARIALSDEALLGGASMGNPTHGDFTKKLTTLYHTTNRTYWSAPELRVRFDYDGTANGQFYAHHAWLSVSYRPLTSTLYRYDGSAWVVETFKHHDGGGTFTQKPCYRWDGSTWVQVHA